MENNSFVTETDAKYAELQTNKALVIVFLIFSLVACLGFLVAWQTFAFFEGIVLISCFITFFSKKRSGNYWRLEFVNDNLTVTNLKSGKSFHVDNVPATDFVITQTKSEIPLDYCSLMIKNTVFVFGTVKNCTQLKEYIDANYKHPQLF